MTVSVDPDAYQAASRVFGERFAGGVGNLLFALQTSLVAAGGCAGNDEASAGFADTYDQAAQATVQVVGELASAGTTVALLLQESGFNHARADAHSNIDGSDLIDTKLYTPASPQSIAIPSLHGGGIFGPPNGWQWVAAPFGGVWPDGLPDELRVVGKAWQAAARDLDGLWDSVGKGIAALEGQQSPELEQARAVCRSLGESATSIAEQCRSIGDAVVAHAQQIEKVRGELIAELGRFLAETALIETAALAVGAATIGAGAAAMQTAQAAAVARAWERVKAILATLSLTANSAGGNMIAVRALDGVHDGLRGVTKLSPKIAETTSVSAGLKVMKDLADKLADSKWPLGPATRGFELEARYGGNLPPGFPTIDKYDKATGIVTSIKSTDLAAKTYQDPGRLRKLIQSYIDKVAGFKGNIFSGMRIKERDIAERELLLVIPRGASPEQKAVLAEMAEYAQQKGVTWTLEVSR